MDPSTRFFLFFPLFARGRTGYPRAYQVKKKKKNPVDGSMAKKQEQERTRQPQIEEESSDSEKSDNLTFDGISD